MKTRKFKIASYNLEFKLVDGYLIDINGFEEFDFFVFKNEFASWVITELTTGFRIPISKKHNNKTIKSVKQACGEYLLINNNLDKVIETAMRRMISLGIEFPLNEKQLKN